MEKESEANRVRYVEKPVTWTIQEGDIEDRNLEKVLFVAYSNKSSKKITFFWIVYFFETPMKVNINHFLRKMYIYTHTAEVFRLHKHILCP